MRDFLFVLILAAAGVVAEEAVRLDSILAGAIGTLAELRSANPAADAVVVLGPLREFRIMRLVPLTPAGDE